MTYLLSFPVSMNRTHWPWFSKAKMTQPPFLHSSFVAGLLWKLSDPPKTTPAGLQLYGPLPQPKLPFAPSTVITLVPGTSNGPMSKVLSDDEAAPASAASVRLPIVPTSTPLTTTAAKSSAATDMEPEIGRPTVLKVLEKVNSAGKAGTVAPVIPAAQIQVAPGIVDRGAVQPLPAYPYCVAPAGQGEGDEAFRQTFWDAGNHVGSEANVVVVVARASVKRGATVNCLSFGALGKSEQAERAMKDEASSEVEAAKPLKAVDMDTLRTESGWELGITDTDTDTKAFVNSV